LSEEEDPPMKGKDFRFCIGIFSILFAVTACAGEEPSRPGDGVPPLNVPGDIRIESFATDLPSARHMAFDDTGTLFLSQTGEGMVVALPDGDGDGRADRTVTIMEGRRRPHGLAFTEIEGGLYLYVAEENQVIRLKREKAPFTFGEPEVVVSDIPVGGHVTRTIKIRNGQLYLSVGSSCNVCLEKEEIRAAVSQYDLGGGGGEIIARGLRNTVGMEFSPWTGELWGVNNGRDWLGDDHPKEELNIIRRGKHYGWPFCYEDRIPDGKYGELMDCAATEPPASMFTAHMAPLGMAFYRRGNLPDGYDNSLFIAFHGSWNRSSPAGYKVVRVTLSDEGEILSDEDFISGWLRADESVTGRPVDLELSPKGDLYLSDDKRGMVYRITARRAPGKAP
jgi:glucose/arabinose dehydrogenase